MARPLALLLLSFLLALPGCASPARDGGTDVAVVTNARDYRDLMANSTGEHVHDYWGGQDHLQVLDATQSSTWNNLGSGSWTRVFTPKDGTTIPQGTSRLDVAVEWRDTTAANAYGAVSLWVKPPTQAEPRFVKAVRSGEDVPVPVAQNESDLPHQLLSGWEFTVRYNGSGGPYNLFFGSTHVTVEAHRGYDLVPFPAHPDAWRGRTTLGLIDATGTLDNVGYTGSGNLPEIVHPAQGHIVPFDAKTAAVRLQLSPDVPVGRLQLWYHGADNRTWTALDPKTGPTWQLRLEPGQGDGPYAKASLWEFQLYTPDIGPQSILDPAVYRGTWHLNVTAEKA